jgi:hypothetical protein
MSKSNGKGPVDHKEPVSLTRVAPKAVASPALGATLAKMDPAELDQVFLRKQEALFELAADVSLPEATRNSIIALHRQASPNKAGMEEVSIAWRPPEIKIVQSTTTAASRPESSRAGDMFTTAGEALPKLFSFVPVHFNQENVLFPMDAKRPECQAPDAKLGRPYGECTKCPHQPFGQQNGGRGEQNKTDCNNQIVAAVLGEDLSQLYIVRFAKTSRKAGSQLLQLSAAQTMIWQQSYYLSTEKGQGTGNYHVFKVAPTGKNNSPHAMRVAQALCDLYTADRHRKLATHYRGVSEAADEAAQEEANFEKRRQPGGDVEPFDGDGADNARTSVRGSSRPM